ncbi:hypothetical protein BIV57_18945 [Mangrovactinospora gilvigrisea]|uniref:AB hydrolase-1 domain-containing protein n=1 Tax=Mangrovactinospora gilvigrisea TaxID=1428644 RepID=A0A1J7BBE2_9ACTN|nr:alpha/beta hydrolase [Mangrovactinospora gilvigrisea]OIV35942.1 hypothetical protein BIV57_18945 [Mangrovactinospora gilvigrisea]
MAQELNCRHSGSGMPLVLLHAFPLTSWMWDAQRSALADLCHVITPDLRGFGASEPHDLSVTDAPDLDRMAEDVAAVLDRYGFRKAVIGGLSMGGYVAMAFARKYPERLEGLVLADTKPEADTPAAAAARREIADTVLHEGSPRVLVEELAPKLFGRTTATQRPGVVENIRWMVEQAHPTGIAWAERAMAARPDYGPVLAALDVPALIVHGDEDAMIPLETARGMQEAIPDAELAVLRGAGHIASMETPGEFDVALRRWVKKVLAARKEAERKHGHLGLRMHRA